MNNHDEKLKAEIVRRLISDFAFKDNKEWLQQGKCPECGKKELFVHKDKPWMVHCGRLNKCGAVISVREIYADLFESWSDRFPQTPENPKAAADAYLRDMRGFDLAKTGDCYSQHSWHDHQTGQGTATVRFTLADNVFWERLIDRPKRFDRKANFIGEYKGLWWVPPKYQHNLKNQREIWITEGIFNAIALMHCNICAVATMSSGNYPARALAELASQCGAENLPRPGLVWAMDNDQAGRDATIKFHHKARNEWHSSAAQPPDGKGAKDWNDLYIDSRLDNKHTELYRYNGSLLLAGSALEKALLIYRKTKRPCFTVEYDNRIFYFKLDVRKINEEMRNCADEDVRYLDDENLVWEKAVERAGCLSEIMNCNPVPLYYQADRVTDEAWFYFNIKMPKGKNKKAMFTAAQLSSASEFKTRLLHASSSATYTGTTEQLNYFIKPKLENIKTIETINYIGYDIESGAYIFADVAVKDGKLYKTNSEDYFEINKLNIKSTDKSVKLQLNADFSQEHKTWHELWWQAYGAKGIAVLAFWLGTAFAEQIREDQKSFPFLELVGKPGSGKTTMLDIMWKLYGRAGYEGFDPSISSLAAATRNLAQVSNLPVVLMEGDRLQDKSRHRGFNWEQLKTAYNGRAVRPRGVRTPGNETYEPPFRGAIVIAQNANVNATQAVLERILHVETDLSEHTDQSRAAAQALSKTPIEKLSGFLLRVAMKEKMILDCVQRWTNYEKELEKAAIEVYRIRHNHSLLMALTDALALVIPLHDWQIAMAHECIKEMAAERQMAISEDHPAVIAFWETYEYLQRETKALNHSIKDDVIAISLNQFYELAAERRQQLMPITDIKPLLKNSQRYRFIKPAAVRSAINEAFNKNRPLVQNARQEVVYCWIFEKKL